MSALDRLCALAGIEPDYRDGLGQLRRVPDQTRRALLAALGYPAESDAALAESLAAAVEEPWRQALPSVRVVRLGEAITLPLILAPDVQSLLWRLECEDGTRARGRFKPQDLPLVAAQTIDGDLRERRDFTLPLMPLEGYHRLLLETPDGGAAMHLIVAPRMAYQPPALAGDGRVWGLSAQVYGLRSARDWGVGGYSEVGALAEGLGRNGADVLGLSPLTALFPHRSEKFSPYAASSRLALNWLFVDPPRELAGEARALTSSPEFQAQIAAARAGALIDYPAVAALKRALFEALYAAFRQRKDPGPFRAWLGKQSETLRRHAIFEALAEAMQAEGHGWWREWPAAYRRPEAPAVAAFARKAAKRVGFFAYVQYLADTQLGLAAERARTGGMRIGLYRDLAVGAVGDGAEAWSFQDTLASGVSMGAPPDALGPLGQDWGIPPWNPRALAADGYRGFAEVLRATMRHAGALRIDHALGLNRQFWVPRGEKANAGGYVALPLDDLLGIIALESQRAKCLVVAEDLGTVPPGLPEKLQAAGLLSYRVLYFERAGDGRFKAPEHYTRPAAAVVATHDLSTLRGFWTGHDIALRAELGLFPTNELRQQMERARADDRWRLVNALIEAGLLPQGTSPEQLDFDALSLAVHAYLARTPARLCLVQVEDVLGIEEQANLPGTVDEHPNWRRRLPLGVAELLADGRLARLAAELGRIRPRG